MQHVTDIYAVLESYITHIRIVEDAAYPSAPPPPDSNPELKKPRLIIVAVRKSGHVRMHKARENLNGTFSIGKTWPLDDLSAVESFSGAATSTTEERTAKAMGRWRWIYRNDWQSHITGRQILRRRSNFSLQVLSKYMRNTPVERLQYSLDSKTRRGNYCLGATASQSRTQPPLVQNSASAPQPPSSAPPYQTRFQRQPPPRDGVLQSTTPDSSLRQQSQVSSSTSREPLQVTHHKHRSQAYHLKGKSPQAVASITVVSLRSKAKRICEGWLVGTKVKNLLARR